MKKKKAEAEPAVLERYFTPLLRKPEKPRAHAGDILGAPLDALGFRTEPAAPAKHQRRGPT